MKLRLSILVLIVVLVSACEVSVTPDPFIGAPTVTASPESGTPPALADGTVTANAAAYYRVNVPDDVANEDEDPLLYVEAVAETDEDEVPLPLTVTVYNSARTALLASNNDAWFTTASELSTAATPAAVLPQAIDVQANCLGPCVITNNDDATLYVRVSTSSPSPVAFELFAYDNAYGDSTEPENNDCGTLSANAIIVSPEEEGYVGALETLGDVDCFRSAAEATQVTLSTTPNNVNVNIQARIYDANTNRLLDSVFVSPNSPTASITLSGSRLVYAQVSAPNTAAGPSRNSTYEITF